MPKFIAGLEKIVWLFNAAASAISGFLMVCMMLLTVGDVMGRFILHRPILGTHELTYLWLALIVFLGLGYTQLKKGHIEVGVIVDKLPVRIQAVVDALTYLLMIVILFLMAKQMYQYAMMSKKTITGDLGLPVYVFVLIGAAGALLYALAAVVDLIKALIKVVRPHES